MNSSILTTDRSAHLKIVVTALTAAIVVLLIGFCARPADGDRLDELQSRLVTTTMASASH
jgi:hypothetical protein